MASRSSHKSRFAGLAIAVLVLSGVGCEASPAARGDASRNSAEAVVVREPGLDAYDFGEDWAGPAPGRRPASADTSADPEREHWAVLLATFSGPAGRERAQQELALVRMLAPQLADSARVHTTARGSTVIYGRYADAQGADAQADLDRVKQLSSQGRLLFPRAMLTRVTPEQAERTLKPNELMTARRTYPNVDPLYTLQVAAFSDFDSGMMTGEEVRRQAEAYCAQLRARGQEAYFHHDAAKGVSIVTVGLFDRTAIDPASGLLSTQVQEVANRFPAHLVNGEPLREPIDPRRPELGTKVQQPRLVLVPMR